MRVFTEHFDRISTIQQSRQIFELAEKYSDVKIDLDTRIKNETDHMQIIKGNRALNRREHVSDTNRSHVTDYHKTPANFRPRDFRFDNI